MLEALRYHLTVQGISLDLIFLVGVILAWFAPRLGDGAFAAIEKAGAALARRKTIAIVSVGLLTIALRLSLLWLMG